MKKTLMMSAAVAALVLTTGLAGAQGPAGGSQGTAPSAPAAAPPAATSQPSGGAPPSGGAMNRGDRPSASDATKSDGLKSSQSGDRMQREGNQPNERAQDSGPDTKQPNSTKADTPSGSKAAQDQKAQPKTTGQAGAGAKISTEQRTQIRTVIKQQNVKPTTNINFSISIGTRVPRSGVSFYPLPTQIISIYPDWRGYEYFLVNDEIIVVNPRTLEIVAVLEA